MATTSDRELLEAHLSGDEQAFTMIVRKYGPLVLGRCRRLLGDSDADDAAQAVFTVLIRKAKTIRNAEALPIWLLRTSNYVAETALRARRRRQRAERNAAVRMDAAADVLQVKWGDVEPILDDALDRLPHRERRAVVLHYFCGHTHAEVGTELRCPEKTAQGWIRKGLLRMRLRMKSAGVDAPTVVLAPLLQAHATVQLPASLHTSLSTLGRTGTSVGPAAGSGAAVDMLIQGGLKAMLIAKLKTFAVVAVSSAACAAFSVSVVVGADNGPSDPPTPTPRGPAAPSPKAADPMEPLEALWRQVAEARKFTFHAPWRSSAQRAWRAMLEAKALNKIVRMHPGGLDEAKARTRLAVLCGGYRRENSPAHQLRLAQAILLKLMKSTPDTKGLVAAVDAAGAKAANYGRAKAGTPFVDDARAYLRARFHAGGADAAEAGFRLAEHFAPETVGERKPPILPRKQQFSQVARNFPDSTWGVRARLLVANDSHGRRGTGAIQRLINFADSHKGDPAAGAALAWASGYYGSTSYGYIKEPQGADPIPRWVKAMELAVRYAKEYPDGADLGSGYNISAPSLYAYRPNFKSDPGRLEQLFKEFYALHPMADGHFLNGPLAKAKRIADRGKQVDYFIEFWRDVEKLAHPDRLKHVLLGKAVFFESWTREQPMKAGPQVIATCRRILEDFPKGNVAASALDLTALHQLHEKKREEAAATWRSLLEKHPNHPLAPMAALNALEIEERFVKPGDWRARAAETRKQFPSDPAIECVVPFLLGRSFESEDLLVEAIQDYRAAQQVLDVLPRQALDWRARIGGPWSSGRTIVGLEIRGAKVAAKIDEWAPYEKGAFKDLTEWRKLSRTHGERRIELLTKFMVDFPVSSLVPKAALEVGKQYEYRKRYDEARAAYAEIGKRFKSNAAGVLMARVAVLDLNHRRLGTPPPAFRKKSADQTTKLCVQELRAALKAYKKATCPAKQPDDLAADVAAIQEATWNRALNDKGRPQVPGAPVRPQPNGKQAAPDDKTDPEAKWVLIDGTLQVDRFDGRSAETTVYHDFAGFPNAACIARRDLKRLTERLGIKRAGGRGLLRRRGGAVNESNFTKAVVHTVFQVSRMSYQIGPGPFLLGPRMKLTRIRFLNKERTKAAVDYSHGQRGGTWIYEKRNGKWVYTRTSGQWIS